MVIFADKIVIFAEIKNNMPILNDYAYSFTFVVNMQPLFRLATII
jgi:hypothetical protein